MPVPAAATKRARGAPGRCPPQSARNAPFLEWAAAWRCNPLPSRCISSRAGRRCVNLTEKSLKSPVGVAVGVGLIIVLGIVALMRLPVQLFPDIDEPVITIFTGWRAAAPPEVESELIEPQEQALRGLAGLQEIQSFANAGGSVVNLEFAIGTGLGRT